MENWRESWELHLEYLRRRRALLLQPVITMPENGPRWCLRCRNRGYFTEQVSGPGNTRRVICSCGKAYENLGGAVLAGFGERFEKAARRA